MENVSTGNWLRLLGLGLIWGASFMAVTVALRGFGPLTVAALRLALGALVLVALVQAGGRGLPKLSQPGGAAIWLFALGMALASNAVPFSLLSWAQKSVASGFAGVCMAVVPLIVLPLAHLFVPGEAMNLRRLVGFVIGTCGVVVLIGPGAFASTGAETEMLARLACVGAAGCYAIGAILTRRCPTVDPISLSAAVLLLAGVIMLPAALAVEGLPAAPGWDAVLAVLYLGLLPTALAQILLVQVIRTAGPTFMSLVNYQVPVWSVLLGVVLLAEPLPPSLLAALGLILLGVGLSQLGALRRLFGG